MPLTQVKTSNLDTTNSLMFRNRIINGDMRIDQRNAGASITQTVTQNYAVDRWWVYGDVTSKLTLQRNAGSVTPPAGFTNYYGITVASAYTPTTGQNFNLTQYIEGLNVADLDFGKSTAKTVTASFWVRSSLTGTFGGCLGNGLGSRSYIFSFTINSANTWEYKTITIPGDITGTWNTDNNAGMSFTIALGNHSGYLNTPNSAWAAGDFRGATGSVQFVGNAGATMYITGVQLEVGTAATAFERRPYGTELQLCQRYCYVIRYTGSLSQIGMMTAQSSASAFLGIYLPTTPRVNPTGITASSGTCVNTYAANSNVTSTSIAIGSGWTSAGNYAPIYITTAGSLTAGQAGPVYFNAVGATIEFTGMEL